MHYKSLVLLLACLPAWAQEYRVSSPDEHLSVTLRLSDGRLSYEAFHDGRRLVDPSPLGLVTAEADLSQGLSYVSESMGEVNEPYVLASGKQRECRDRCRQLLLSLKGERDLSLWVFFRVYDDGFAFRYTVGRNPQTDSLTVTDDASRIRVSNYEYCLGSKFIGGIVNPNYPYESYYARYSWKQMLHGEGDRRLNAPALVSNGTDYLLLSEANNDGGFSMALLRAEDAEGEFSFRYAGEHKDYKVDKPQQLRLRLPLHTPWRMAITGSLPTVFASVMTESLCPPAQMKNTSWIRPGRASWDWGGSDGEGYKPLTREEADSLYIELGAQMGWEYTLIDGGWHRETVRQTIDLAHRRGLKALLWQTAALRYNKTFSNEQMEQTLDEWKSWGVDGIKIDFWEDDSHETMQRIEHLLRAAGERQLVVNLHGSPRPSGLRRTYPHLLSYEAVLGGEQNFWNGPRQRAMWAEHHVNLCLTRNVIGPADFTPGDFALRTGTLLSNVSQAQRMALLTAFENGLLHVCESPDNLRYFLGLDIMRRVPVVWDESRLLEAEVQQYVTIARRAGNDWWLSGLTVKERTARVRLDFLPRGKTYTAYIYKDGTCRTDMLFERRRVTHRTTLRLPEMDGGGFLVQLSPDDSLPVPEPVTVYEAESRHNTLSPGVEVYADDPLYASGGQKVCQLGKGRELTFNRIRVPQDGSYALTIYYATAEDRQAELLVDGRSLGQQTFCGNRSSYCTYDAVGLGWHKVVVSLTEGEHSITLRSGRETWAPDVDRIMLQRVNGE